MKIAESLNGAGFSPSREYRYILWRRWSEGGKVLFIGLNPSTANEQSDDPTVRRCVGFANDWGYAGIYLVNLFALVTSDPKLLATHHEPIGRGNDLVIKVLRRRADIGLVIAAWGNEALKYPQRWQKVVELLRPVCCMGLTGSGQPRHPLYLPKNTEVEAWL